MFEQIVINQSLISYSHFSGQGAGKTLIFLHGWRSQKEVWNEIVASSKYQVSSIFCVDLPGFGSSSVPPKVFGIGDYAEAVKEFIGKLELKNVILVGHSFGGRVAIKLATTHPTIVSKLVLVDSAGFAMPSLKKNIITIVAKIVKPFFKPRFMQGLRKKIYQQIGAEDYVATPELQKTFINIVNEDLTEDMKRIKIPTLIIFGENDADTPPSFGEKMQSLILNSKFIILKNAGHFSFLDKPEEFVSSLKKFVSDPNMAN